MSTLYPEELINLPLCSSLLVSHVSKTHFRYGSLLGMNKSSTPQLVEVEHNCSEKHQVLFLLFIALGRLHENLREDRDKFVNVLWTNIIRGK